MGEAEAKRPSFQELEARTEMLRLLESTQSISNELCLTCKGARLLCGYSYCPLLQRISVRSPVEARLSERMFGPVPSIFVGWRSYPEVYAGPLTAVLEADTHDAAFLDDPSRWYGLGLDEIVRLRSILVRSRRRQHIRNLDRVAEATQELALSAKPIDAEVRFKSRPKYGLSFSPVTQPMGPTGELVDLSLAGNPVIPRRVDRLLHDDVRATDAAGLLYEEGFGVYYIARVLSSGALGTKLRRHLVPTRWSITATDDMLGRRLMRQVREFPQLDEILLFENTFLDNHFEVLLLPGAWQYEQFEAWAPRTIWTMARTQPAIIEEREGYSGRSDYAAKEAGGYYAGRLAVLEALVRMRRQATAVVFRETYEGYVIPVGVWEVRENVRHAFDRPPRKFATLKEALADAGARLRYPVREYFERSWVLRQRSLDDFR